MARGRRVRWSERARRDLEGALAYLFDRNREAARRLSASVREVVRRLERHPESGAFAEDIDPQGRYRHVVAGNLRLIYRIEAGTAIVIRVWDARRNPEQLTLQ